LIGLKFHFFSVLPLARISFRNRYRSGQVDHRYGNNGARRSSGGPIGVGVASVVPGLCWETRTSLYRLQWRRRVVSGSCLGRHQPRHGERRRWRYSAKLMRLILSAHQLTLPPLPLIVSEYLSGTPLRESFSSYCLFIQPSGLEGRERKFKSCRSYRSFMS